MSTFTTALTAAIALLITLGPGPLSGAEHPAAVPVGPIDSPFPAVHPLGPPAPRLHGVIAPDASPEQQERVNAAVATFDDAGLELPPLEVQFHDDAAECRGNAGLFVAATDSWKRDVVLVCSRLPIILLHEFAHAWEHHGIDDGRRTEFTESWGLPTWRDTDFEWEDRGIEMAAHTIAFTLATTAPVDSEHITRFGCSYEQLTGNELPNPEFFECS